LLELSRNRILSRLLDPRPNSLPKPFISRLVASPRLATSFAARSSSLQYGGTQLFPFELP
jgi:hypothetical protein